MRIWFEMHTLESILVDITDSSYSKAKGRAGRTFEHHSSCLLERSVFIHEDINCSSLVFHAVEIKGSAHNQVIPAARKVKSRL